MIQTRLLIVPLSALLLSACVVAPYPARPVVYSQPIPAYRQPVPQYGEADPADEAVVDIAPPAPYVEVVPAIPFAGAVWIGGYWGWAGGRHQWHPGRWERPRPGYSWRAHSWVNQGGRWHLHGGGWARH
ncbi:MAG TPA: hypothetical protein VNU71_22510 [Burkholderiaceae bacterium]|nr:hypothetical protein [Burkholderiaceae bacterium]